jgi:hypothetical protein
MWGGGWAFKRDLGYCSRNRIHVSRFICIPQFLEQRPPASTADGEKKEHIPRFRVHEPQDHHPAVDKGLSLAPDKQPGWTTPDRPYFDVSSESVVAAIVPSLPFILR